MESIMKVIAINGSPNLGYTNYMVDQALGELKARGAECEKIILNQFKIGLCQGCPDCRDYQVCPVQDDGTWIMEKYRQADGIILSSPVWFHTICSQMKVFMDRSIFLNRHNGLPKAKCAGLIAIAGRSGADMAVDELMKFFTGPDKKPYSDMKIITIAAYHGGPGRKPEEMVEVIEQIRNLGRKMAEILFGDAT